MEDWSTGFFYVALVLTSLSSLLWITTIFYCKLAGIIPVITASSWIFLTLAIIFRAAVTGHGPFSNMFEFSLAFAWGITTLGILLWWRSRLPLIIGLTSVLSTIILIFTASLSSRVISLIPALQQSVLLSFHVAAAVIAYGAFAVGFGLAVVYLIKTRGTSPDTAEMESIDRISYQSAIIGFPFLTLTIILGAVWAEITWAGTGIGTRKKQPAW